MPDAVAMRPLLLACLVLSAIAAVPSATAVGPGAGSCNAVTNPCGDDSLVCTWYSLQVPFCVDNPTDEIRQAISDVRDAVSIDQPDLPPLVGSCNAFTNPCWDDSVVCVWFSLQVPQCVDPIRVD
jgi:hypothetical protein